MRASAVVWPKKAFAVQILICGGDLGFAGAAWWPISSPSLRVLGFAGGGLCPWYAHSHLKPRGCCSQARCGCRIFCSMVFALLVSPLVAPIQWPLRCASRPCARFAQHGLCSARRLVCLMSRSLAPPVRSAASCREHSGCSVHSCDGACRGRQVVAFSEVSLCRRGLLRELAQIGDFSLAAATLSQFL